MWRWLYRTFSRYNLKIIKNNTVIIEGKRNCQGLCDTPLASTNVQPEPKPQKKQELANGISRQRQIKVELAEYLLGSCFGPAKSTLIRAINKKHFTSRPGMTHGLINKHLPKSVGTAKGHLDQEATNLQSTKTNVTPMEHGIGPPHEDNNAKTKRHHVQYFWHTKI